MSHQIKYTGPTQHTRQISKTDAKSAGFVLPENLEWSLSNRHTLLLDELDESALEFFKGDPDFRVTEVDDEDDAKPAKKTAEEKVAEETLGKAGGGGSSIGTGGGTRGGGGTTTSTTTATT